MNEHTTRRQHENAARSIDAVGFWFDGPGGEHRARQFARFAKRIGLDPGDPHNRAGIAAAKLEDHHELIDVDDGAGLRFSLAPAWRRPGDLRALLGLARGLRARVYRLELALDWLGQDPEHAARLWLPSLLDDRLDPDGDAVRLRRRRRRIIGQPLEVLPRLSWRVYRRTRYLHEHGAPVNLVAYWDRPSKLDPNGGPVLHVEVRIMGRRLEGEGLASPDALIELLDAENFDRVLAGFVDLERVTSRLGTVPLCIRSRIVRGASWGGVCAVSRDRLARSARCALRHVPRALAALEHVGSVVTIERGDGRGNFSTHRLGTSLARDGAVRDALRERSKLRADVQPPRLLRRLEAPVEFDGA